MIYLAAPYTHSDPAVMQQRVETANQCLLALTDEGHTTFSPLSYFPMLSPALPEKSYDFWLEKCLDFVAVSHALVVIPIPGWRESKGVSVEVFTAINAGLQVGCFFDSVMAEKGLLEAVTQEEFQDALKVMMNPMKTLNSLILPSDTPSNVTPITSVRKQ